MSLHSYDVRCGSYGRDAFTTGLGLVRNGPRCSVSWTTIESWALGELGSTHKVARHVGQSRCRTPTASVTLRRHDFNEAASGGAALEEEEEEEDGDVRGLVRQHIRRA